MFDCSLISQLVCWGFFVFLRYIFPFGPKRSIAFYSDDRSERIRLRIWTIELHGSAPLRRRPSVEDVRRTRDSLNRSFPGLDVAGEEIADSCYEDEEGKIVIENSRVSRRFWSSDIGDVSMETLGKYESLRKAVEEPIATRLQKPEDSEDSEAEKENSEAVGRTVDSFESLSAFESEAEAETASSTTSSSRTRSESEVSSAVGSREKTEPDAFTELLLRLCPELDEMAIYSFQEVEKGNFEDLDVIECFQCFPSIMKTAQDTEMSRIREFYTQILQKANPLLVSKCLHLMNSFSHKIDFSEVIFAVFDRFVLGGEVEMVRWNLLDHLADIAQTFSSDPENLYQFVARIGTFPPPANPRNWRYLELYLHQCAEMVMLPIGMEQLLQIFGETGIEAAVDDARSPVRTQAARLLARVLSRIVALEEIPEDSAVGKTSLEFNARLLSLFAEQKRNWRRRQLYAYIIEFTCAENLLNEVQFYAFFATPFFHYIVDDPVPNIRLQFARALLRSDPEQFCSFGLSVYAKFLLEKASRVDESPTVRRLAAQALNHLGGYVPVEEEKSDDVDTAIEPTQLSESSTQCATSEDEDSDVCTAEEISE